MIGWEKPEDLASRVYEVDYPRSRKAAYLTAKERDEQVAARLDAIVAGPAHELLPGLVAFLMDLRPRVKV